MHVARRSAPRSVQRAARQVSDPYGERPNRAREDDRRLLAAVERTPKAGVEQGVVADELRPDEIDDTVEHPTRAPRRVAFARILERSERRSKPDHAITELVDRRGWVERKAPPSGRRSVSKSSLGDVELSTQGQSDGIGPLPVEHDGAPTDAPQLVLELPDDVVAHSTEPWTLYE